MHRLLSFVLFFAAFPAFSQTLRTDIQQNLQSLLCGPSKTIPSTRELWQKNIFETQLDAAWIRSADGKVPLVINDLAQIARDQAGAKKHLGFAFGLCNPAEAWIVSTPSGAPLSQWTAEGLRFDIKAMRSRCQTVSLHYAEATGGRSKHLHETDSKDEETFVLHPELLRPGTIGLTCQPSLKKKEGPELWSLIPIHKPSVETVPHFAALRQEGIPSLIQWIQDIRQSQGLKSLKTDSLHLQKFAQQLAAETSIRHPRAQLLKERKRLAILGEDRVKATSNQEMAWLLWYSPTHRQLLLHKSARTLGFELTQLSQEKLLVLVLAKN